MKKTYLSSSIDKFYDRASDINDLFRAGEAVVAAIYGGEEGEDLNDYRVWMLCEINQTKRFNVGFDSSNESFYGAAFEACYFGDEQHFNNTTHTYQLWMA